MKALLARYVAYVRTTQDLAADLGIPAATLTPAIALTHMNALADAYEILHATPAATLTPATLTPATPANVVVSAATPIPPFVGTPVARQTGSLPVRTDPVHDRHVALTRDAQAARKEALARLMVDNGIHVAPIVHTTRNTPAQERAIVNGDVDAATFARHAGIPVRQDRSGNIITQVPAITCVVCGKLTTNRAAHCTACVPVRKGDESGHAPIKLAANVAPITGAVVKTTRKGANGKRKPAIVPAPVKATTANVAPTRTDSVPGLSRSGAIAAEDTKPAPAAPFISRIAPADVADADLLPVPLTMEFVAALKGMPDHATRERVVSSLRLLPGEDPSASLAYTALMYGANR